MNSAQGCPKEETPEKPACPLSPALLATGPKEFYFYFISSKSHAFRIDKRFDFLPAALGGAGGWRSGAVVKRAMQQTLRTSPLRRKTRSAAELGLAGQTAGSSQRSKEWGGVVGAVWGGRGGYIKTALLHRSLGKSSFLAMIGFVILDQSSGLPYPNRPRWRIVDPRSWM
jgi:hypothetical protein